MNKNFSLKENNKPPVDVILPNYNKSEFLIEAINSVLSQTYKNWVLYIVDDKSSDNSWRIIENTSNLKNIIKIKLKKKYVTVILQKLCYENI